MGRRLAAVLAASVLAVACTSADSGSPPGGDGNPPDRTPPPADKESPPPTKPGDVDPPAPAEPAVAFVGRFAIDGDTRTFGWPNTRILARFEGTGVSATLAETNLYAGPSELDLRVDDKVQVLKLKEGEHVYELAKDLPAGEHVVELIRRVEGQVGVTKFKGFDFGGGKLLAPPKPRTRKIEFLGDSNTTGYGVEGKGPNCPFSASTQNVTKTYAAKVADAFDADALVIAYSGKGVVQNNDRNDPIVFEDLFTRATPESATPAWDFTKAPAPDAVLINLGSNDYAQPRAGVVDPPAFGAFKEKFAKLVSAVRAQYAAAPIFVIVSPTQNDWYPVGFDAHTNQKRAFTEVVAARKTGGDDKVHFIDLPVLTDDAERDGCDYHPGVKIHDRMATTLIAEIKKVTGW
ncbi:MAG: hypothetical protein KIT84_24350 [Labilithrix sp.]|nr:hypothetical protein [Labilithrix sp.]MCW5814182.1 hypothetical protein [Labilithrix sp.]